MYPYRTPLLLLTLLWAQNGVTQNLGDPDCDVLWLVSSYSTNAVKIYDGCSGEYIQDMEDNDWLAGPQAIVEDGNGGLLVVSEENDRVIRFDRETLEAERVISGDDPETAELEPALFDAPTGLAVSSGGRVFVGSFTRDRVLEIKPDTGAFVQTVVAANQGVEGVDAGMWIQDNQLYVPGFDSSTIVAVNIDQAPTPQVLIPAGSNGLNAARTIIVDDNGDLLVTSWRGNQILAYDRSNGNFKRVVANIPRPAGMTMESPGILLVTSDQSNDVKRVRVSDGSIIDTPVPALSGGLNGATWITIIEKLDVPVDTAATQNNAFFLIGVGAIDGTTISVDPMIYTTGGLWGADLEPTAIGEQTWGVLLIEFTGCNGATMSYDSDEAVFGNGGYALVRLANSPLGDDCSAVGFDNVTDNTWMSGHFYGGSQRSGEGFSIDVINGNQVIVTFYSYLPTSLISQGES